MPKMEKDRVVFLPEDRNAIDEQSPDITPSSYATLFSQALSNGNTTEYFKFLEEIKEKDPDILHSIETRTSYVTSKEWQIEDEKGETEGDDAMKIDEALRAIPGDPKQGLITVDELIASMLGSSYLTGISMNEIVTDSEQITGFNHIPSHFLTFQESVYYPKLWTQESQAGEDFIPEKMISHYLTKSTDPARGWLGNGVGWQYVWKRNTLNNRLRFEDKYGKGFLQLNMPGAKDTYVEDWVNAERLINNIDSVNGVVFGSEVEGEFHELGQSEGEYFFTSNDEYKQNITKIILGQDSTSSAEDSNRSTADVHMEVLEQRTLDDIKAIEDTLNRQLIPAIKDVLNISEDKQYSFKFVVSDLEATLDEEMDDESATEDDKTGGATAEQPEGETDE